MDIKNLFSLQFLPQIEQTDYLVEMKEKTHQTWFEIFCSLTFELQNTPKTNDKKNILKRHYEFSEWKTFLQFSGRWFVLLYL